MDAPQRYRLHSYDKYNASSHGYGQGHSSYRNRERDRERVRERERYRDRERERERERGPPPRRRRASLWDSREYQYGIPVPAPRGSMMSPTPFCPPARSTEVVVVRAAEPHERERGGALAGIDIPALRALLNGADPATITSTLPSVGGSGVGAGAGTNSEPATPIGPWAIRGARRLYVGNLPDGTTEKAVEQFFNEVLFKSKGAETEENPVVTTYLKMEKRFAFIELRTVSEAAACLMLDGLMFHGTPLRIRRPNDFPATGAAAQPPPNFNPAVLGVVCTLVPDTPNKIFIGGIPYHLNEDQVRDLLTTYGRLSAFNLVKEGATGMSKGYAFCEYMDPKVVDIAVAGLNGMKIEDRTLTVRKASHDGASGAAYDAIPMLSSSVAGSTTAGIGATGAGIGGPLVGQSTRVLELRNVIVEDELKDDEEYEEIVEEMKDEGSKYGKLESVVVPRPMDGETRDQAEARGVGRVFLKYATNAECERANATLSGRKFDQRIVRAAYFDEDKFERNDFA